MDGLGDGDAVVRVRVVVGAAGQVQHTLNARRTGVRFEPGALGGSMIIRKKDTQG